MNCKNIKIQAVVQINNFILENCDRTELYLNEESKKARIQTTCAKMTIINFPGDTPDEHGNEDRSPVIIETYETFIKNDELVSSVCQDME